MAEYAKTYPTAGQPLKFDQLFDSVDDLEAAIEEYFRICDEGKKITVIDKRGDQVTHKQPVPYTMEGLAYHLDCSSETIRQSGKVGKYSGTISRARKRIHARWIEMGMLNQYNPKIVNLCLSASCPDYRPQQDINVQFSIEDRLRQIKQRKQELIDLPAGEDTLDAVVMISEDDNT